MATIGELVLDEIVTEGGAAPRQQLGGGALYSAIGALIWGARPQVHGVVGNDAPLEALEQIEAAGIDLSTLTRVDGPGLGLWLLYQRDGRRQQVQKLGSPAMLEMDLRRTGLPAGCHVDGLHVAPQTAQGQLRALEDARSAGVTTLDCMVEPYIDLEPYRDGRALAGVTAFLPSEQEVTAIWGDIDALELARRLHERSGVQVVIITRGRSGADVVTRDRVVRVPAAPTTEIDATGAGDAFAGGFLVGLIEHADPVRAAVWGSVSASYVVETRGPLEALDRLDPADASRRAAQLSTRVEERAH